MNMQPLRVFAVPVRLARDLPIGAKLASTAVGALILLSVVSWFALERLVAVGAMQDGVATQAATERQIQRALLATLELRVVSRELQYQQTASSVNAAAERAAKQHAIARDDLQQARAESQNADDSDRLGKAIDHLDAIADAVKREAALRTAMLTVRQKRLLLVRPTFESSLGLFVEELARGGRMLSGVDSVRDTTGPAAANADQHDPTLQAMTAYRLAMARMQGAALTFMATGSGAAANEVKDAIAEADRNMAIVMAHDLADAVKMDAKSVDTIGRSMDQAAIDLISQTQQLDAIAHTEVEAVSQSMQLEVEQVAQSIGARARAASEQARQARTAALHDIVLLIGGIAGLMLLFGSVTTYAIAAPIRSLTRAVQAIAGGDTTTVVRFTQWRDETGRMAAAVETLRGVMQQTFVQSQMIEQIPIGVMTAEATGDFRITYVNPETVRLMTLVEDHLPVPPGALLRHSIDIFYRHPERQRAILADPANLPHRERIIVGDETFDLRVSAISDARGAYVGPMLTWHRLTGQVQLVAQFEQTVGAIATTVGASATRMQDTALAMTSAAGDAGQRTAAVAEAADRAAANVSAVSAGAEELAASVAEINRQVTESARIAGAAVQEAEATDQCVSGLNEAAVRIGNVVKLINDIAGRTNLLALNATIEAARAGDAGRGFAVVASEVKTLATQTARATDEIAAQITAMQGATKQAVTALRSIAGTIQRMNEISTTIAGAVEEQGGATQEIARSVQQAATRTNEVNSNITVVAEAMDRSGTQARAVLQAATELTEQSDTLKREVQAFLGAVQAA
jgi:methyl-accepting chemotaxis protein